MNLKQLARISLLSDVFMLKSGLVQFKYVQDIGNVNDINFCVGMAGGHKAFGEPHQYDDFVNKYLTWLESR